MPVIVNMPAFDDPTRATALVAQFAPDPGASIERVGKIITDEANRVPSRIQAQVAAIDAETKLQEQRDKLRELEFIKNNQDLIGQMYRDAYNGKYGEIDFSTVPAFLHGKMRTNLRAEDKAGGERAKTEAEIERNKVQAQEALATIGYRNLQMANERIALSSAQRKEEEDAATANFLQQIWHDREAWPALADATSGEGERSLAGLTKLAQRYQMPNFTTLVKAIDTFKNSKPVNTQAYTDLQTNVEAATDAASSALNSTSLGPLSLKDWSGFLAEGRKYIPHGVGEADWDKLVKNGALVGIANEMLADVLKQHPEYEGLITPEMAIYAASQRLNNSTILQYLTPGTKSLSNGLHINFRNRNFNPFSEDTVENQAGSVLGDLLKLGDMAYKNQRLAKAMHPSAGIFPRMRQILEDEIKKDQNGWLPNKNTASRAEIIRKALPRWVDALLKAGLTEDEATSVISSYTAQLNGEPVPFNFTQN